MNIASEVPRADPATVTVGFIGLGAMGREMAFNLAAAGYRLRVHDVRKQALGAETEWSESAGAAAQGADFVLTCLPGPAEVEKVALGPGGLLPAMQPGSVWIDHTTTAPDQSRRLGHLFADRGIDLLDAPISGGPGGARSRKLAFWVGGKKDAYQRALPLLKAMGDQPMHVGAAGAGCVVKLVHNSASFAVQSAIAEAFVLGVSEGIDPLVLFSALREGTTGRARTFDRLSEQFLPGSYDPPAFTLRLAHKDMMLALEMAKAARVPARMIELAAQDMAEAMGRGFAEKDARIALSLHSERAGVTVKLTPEAIKAALTGKQDK